jgi:hypothetical protein
MRRGASGGVFTPDGVGVLGVAAAFAHPHAVVAPGCGTGGPDVAGSAAATNGEPFPQIKHHASLMLITHCPVGP